MWCIVYVCVIRLVGPDRIVPELLCWQACEQLSQRCDATQLAMEESEKRWSEERHELIKASLEHGAWGTWATGTYSN